MKKKVFSVLLVFVFAILLGSRQSADAASTNYEYVPTTISGKISLLNTQENQCVNAVSGYNALYKGEKINSISCSICGGWINTCFWQRLELSEENYNGYKEEDADLAHGKYSGCSGWNSRNGAGTNHSTRIYYKTEVYEVSNSERVTLSD